MVSILVSCFLYLVYLSTRQLLCHKYTKFGGLCQGFRGVFLGGERRKIVPVEGEKVARVKFHSKALKTSCLR